MTNLMRSLFKRKVKTLTLQALHGFALLLLAGYTLTAHAGETTAPSATNLSEDKAVPQATQQSDVADTHISETLTWSFRQQFQTVLDAAKQSLLQQHTPMKVHAKQAIVLDLDETLLDNRAYFVIYKHYEPTLWETWLQRGEATVIPETKTFVEWLLQEHYRLYFVSGRKERDRAITVLNLQRVGITHYDGLYLKPNDYQAKSASDFKTEARKKIEEQGYHVLLLLGDQASDLLGGYGEGFKLPNPIYQVP